MLIVEMRMEKERAVSWRQAVVVEEEMAAGQRRLRRGGCVFPPLSAA